MDTEQKANISSMDDCDRLALYPFVVVRIGCRQCSRKGAYRWRGLRRNSGRRSRCAT
jgi:hypothetical protein